MKHYTVTNTPDFQEKLQTWLDETEGSAVVTFEPGIYEVDGSIRLTEQHSNIRFTSNGEAVLTGSRVLNQWKPVLGTVDADRFQASVRKQVVYCDLTEAGIGAIRPFRSRGALRNTSLGFSELYADGVPLHLASYPRTGYTHITGVSATSEDEWGERDGVLENGFFWSKDRLKSWSQTNDIWALGFWKHDWANSFEQVDTFDPETGHFQMKPPYGMFGYRLRQRIRFYNIMEEVLEPGDYALDLAQNRVYLYPAKGQKELRIAMNCAPIFDIDHAERITLEHLTLEASCGTAVESMFAEGLHLNNCIIRYMGSSAVAITEGHNPVVENCTLYGCSDSAVVMVGGNRLTLEPMSGRIYNNHIYDIAKWGKCYHTACVVSGVGIEVRHNLIHDCPHTAVIYWGNEIKITDNEIYSVVMETGDAGAIYAGRDVTYRGNEVSHNYIHHLGARVGIGTMGIYNDDTLCGTKMCDNYFEELTRAIQLGGGRELVVKNNVFVKCTPAVHFDSRSADLNSFWEDCVPNNLMPKFYRLRRYCIPGSITERCEKLLRQSTETVSVMESIHIRRYPELAVFHEFIQNQIGEKKYMPGQALIESNLFMSSRRFRYHFEDHGRKLFDRNKEIPVTPMSLAYVKDPTVDIKRGIAGNVGEVVTISNMQADKNDFVDVDWGDLQVVRSPETFQFNYKDNNFYAIGLKEELRRVNPAYVKTRVDFVPGDAVVRIGLRNKKQEPVSGELRLQATDGAVLGADTLTFALAGGEEKYYEVPVMASGSESIIEVRSTTPGVRPSRSV